MLQGFFVVQIRIFVKFDVRVVNAPISKGVSDPFGRHAGEHDGNDVSQAARQLEHDHHQRDGHPSDAAESGRCAN